MFSVHQIIAAASFSAASVLFIRWTQMRFPPSGSPRVAQALLGAAMCCAALATGVVLDALEFHWFRNQPYGAYIGLTVCVGILAWAWLSSTPREVPRPMTDDRANPPPDGRGGKGGDATVVGHGVAKGGRGGKGGPAGAGRGGDGGSAEVKGDGFALGGEGGEAGQPDRPGRGGRSPLEVLGAPNIKLPDGSSLWDYGRGGDGGWAAQPAKKLEGSSDEKK
jgi:hypothetical protein